MTGTRYPSRAIVIVMDSVGVGAMSDADRYGDVGSDTVGNIHRQVPLAVPTLRRLGLAEVAPIGSPRPRPWGAFGRLAERSAGKDSVTGHWELMGLVIDRPFPTFPHGFPADLMAAFEARIGRSTLGNVVASGTTIINELGPRHIETGAPIVYTSADSVFQIAAHEAVIPIEEQYAICRAAFDLAARGLGVARVIARPFTGAPGAFTRTTNRRDFAIEPPAPTLLDAMAGAGQSVVAIGKIDDLFARRGITRAVHTTSDDNGMDVLAEVMASEADGLVFANLVDFDTRFGHRNDVAGYAANLERFDRRLGQAVAELRDNDLLILTADHGNDPTTPSTDHSREYVPVLIQGRGVREAVNLGTRETYADLGQTLAELFSLPRLAYGTSFLGDILR